MQRLHKWVACCAVSAISLSAQSSATSESSPKATLEKFLKVATTGELLTPEGREQAGLLFAHRNSMLF
jgi:hypothetical protein